jgi:hypothetical protein
MSNATNNHQAKLVGGRAPPPAFDPERPAMVQPWRDFEAKGYLEVQRLGGKLTQTVRCKLLEPVLFKENEKGLSEVFTSPTDAKERIIQAGLWTPKVRGKKTGTGKAVIQLPKKSLCKEDFMGNDQSLLSRARSVANTLGDNTAAGRIGSMSLARKGKDTFATWWAGAGGERKSRLLTDKKHFDSLSREDKERLNTVLKDCPFRGSESVPTPTEETEGKPVQETKKANGGK